MAEAYIVAAARTAGGRKGGRLAGWHPADLARPVLDALVDRTGADPAADRGRDHGLRHPGRRAGHQRRAQRRPGLEAAGERAGHQRRPPVRLVAAGAALRRPGGDERHAWTCVIAAGVESMTRVPMGLPSSLPAKDGFGTPKSPNIEKRYPNIQFSQFIGAEMMAEEVRPHRRTSSTSTATTATSAPSPPPRPARSRTRSSPLQDHATPTATTDTHTHRRGHPLRRQPRRHPGREAAARGRRASPRPPPARSATARPA